MDYLGRVRDIIKSYSQTSLKRPPKIPSLGGRLEIVRLLAILSQNVASLAYGN